MSVAKLSILLALLALGLQVVCLLAHPLDDVNLLSRSSSNLFSNQKDEKLYVYIHVKDQVKLSDSKIEELCQAMGVKRTQLDISSRYQKTFTTWLSFSHIEKLHQSNVISSMVDKVVRVPAQDRITFSALDLDSLQYANVRVVFHQEVDSRIRKTRVAHPNLEIQQWFEKEFNQKLNNVLSSTSSNKRMTTGSSQWLREELSNVFQLNFQNEEYEDSTNVMTISLTNFDVNAWPLLQQEPSTTSRNRHSMPQETDQALNFLQRRRTLQQQDNIQAYQEVSQSMGQALLSQLLSQEDAISISREFPQSLLNLGSNQVVQQGGDAPSLSSNSKNHFIWSQNVTGTDQIVQIIDSGVDVNHCYFSKAGENYFSTPNYNNRKIVFYQPVTFWGDKIDNNGHGSHVASTIAGSLEAGSLNVSMSNDIGIAPNAKLYVTDVMKGIFFYVSSLSSYLTTAFNRKARVSSNSWGCANPYDCVYDCRCYEYGTLNLVNDSYCLYNYGVRCCEVCNQYDNNALVVDSFTRDNDEMLIVMAAGNNGYFSSKGTVLSPATSKNSLTVGAQYATLEEYIRFNKTEINGTLYNHQNMGYFSARGPTFDQRSKPDVVAPGVSIYGALRNPTSCSPEGGLTAKSGTSMATPAVAGAAALVRDYLSQNNNSRLVNYELFNKNSTQTISGSLVKAMIIHSAQKMTGFVKLTNDTSPFGISQSLARLPYPNIYNGFGSVNLKNVLLFENVKESVNTIGKLFLLNRYSLAPGDELVLPFHVPEDKKKNGRHHDKKKKNKKPKIPIKVTLTWYDYKGAITNNATATNKQLINDMDLSLKNGHRRVFYGNPSTLRNGTCPYDFLNTVERIEIPVKYIKSVSTSTNHERASLNRDHESRHRRVKSFQVIIKAKDTNIGNQTFSLVVTGPIQSGSPKPRQERPNRRIRG
ncbi:hypothetical protein C9374_002536 [Naegleria lovaniensis]|uniref:Peptidase S8/S53 domain-containing protein n=1 Tax=Naegleria lovaniensis TaxID=51637 RepID=A0AA88GNN7_NAELO|nr:uncharacterized protein C9374_002536 [Naegleria lovaniensis]KAG2386090.1 hypothetical protein C9374_002536 [Naegleria lovaniensis]